MVMGEAEKLGEALRKISDGLKILSGGPTDWYLDRLEDYIQKALDSAPVKKGDRVALLSTLDIEKSSGWYPSRHFLIRGSRGTVCSVCIHKGEWSANVIFDNESWYDAQGVNHLVKEENRHTYGIAASRLEVLHDNL